MKRNSYITPVLAIEHAEAHNIIAFSKDTSEVEWKDDVNLEVKEESGFDNAWKDIW